ncbi:hypothetical protein DFH08DRAFT_884572 [Mycena albidolilacea]|uniref:Uncharacterized protein n=1 Tax=Mycena albidolilacea TaxID=1033008 RepID=A0AAD6ZKX7_9AGAR|nr:hypothetical protein DFH08DRAFT_884572 [Mycena albidolilacea]
MAAFYPELSSRCSLAQHTITGSGGGPSKSPRSFHKCLSCRPPPPWSFPAVPDTPLDLRKVSPQDRQSAGASRDPGIQPFKSSSLPPSSPQSSLGSKLALIEAVYVCASPCAGYASRLPQRILCRTPRPPPLPRGLDSHAPPFVLHPRAASPQTLLSESPIVWHAVPVSSLDVHDPTLVHSASRRLARLHAHRPDALRLLRLAYTTSASSSPCASSAFLPRDTLPLDSAAPSTPIWCLHLRVQRRAQEGREWGGVCD